MKHIISRTMETTIKKFTILLFMATGIATAVILNNNFAIDISLPFAQYLQEILVAQHLIMFFAGGNITMLTIASSASVMIAGEADEGTLRLLVAKPNSRLQILVAKVIGVIISMVILYSMFIGCYFGYISLFSVFEGTIVNEMCAFMPGYFLYGLVVIFVFTALSTFITVFAKKKIVAILPVLAVIIIIVGLFPILRLVSGLSGTASGASVDLVDLNYHMSLIFKTCLSPFGKIEGSSSAVTVMMFLNKLFAVTTADADIVGEFYSSSVVEYNSLSAMTVLASYLGISFVLLITSMLVMRRKDV